MDKLLEETALTLGNSVFKVTDKLLSPLQIQSALSFEPVSLEASTVRNPPCEDVAGYGYLALLLLFLVDDGTIPDFALALQLVLRPLSSVELYMVEPENAEATPLIIPELAFINKPI